MQQCCIDPANCPEIILDATSHLIGPVPLFATLIDTIFLASQSIGQLCPISKGDNEQVQMMTVV